MEEEEGVNLPDGTESTEATVGAAEVDGAAIMDSEEAGLSSNASAEQEHATLKEGLVFAGRGGHAFVDSGGQPCSVEVEGKMDSFRAKDVNDESEAIDLNEVVERGEEECLISEGPERIAVFQSSESTKQLLEHLDGSASSSNSVADSIQDRSSQIDGQIVTESEEDVITDEERKELFDFADLPTFLSAATGTSPGSSDLPTGSDVAHIFSVERPAGLGSSISSMKPPVFRSTLSSVYSPNLVVAGDSAMDEEKKPHEKFGQVSVKFLRLLNRLGCSPEDTMAVLVIYRLGLSEAIKHGRPKGHSFSIKRAKQKALNLEEDLKDDLGFLQNSCTGEN